MHQDEDGGERLWLPPEAVQLHRGPAGQLRVSVETEPERSYLQATVHRAFPLSSPEEWVVLLDGAGREIGTIQDPSALDARSRDLLAEELDLRYLTPMVQEVVSIAEDALEGGSRWSPVLVWDVLTDRGPFQLRLPNLADHLRVLGPGRLLIWDREGRRVEFPSLEALPERSRMVLRRYLAL